MALYEEEPSLSEPNHDLMKMIGELALDLHMNQSVELSFDLPSESPKPRKHKTNDYLIEGKTIRFSSNEVLNRYVAAHVFEKNRQAFANDAQMWLGTANELWMHEIGDNDSVAGRLLAIVDETNDLFLIAATAIENKSMQTFKVFRVVEAALPYLKKVSVNGIVNLCIAQFKRSKNNAEIGILLSGLEKRLIDQPNVCREIYNHIRNNIVDATMALHPISLLALAKSSPTEAVEFALEDAESSDVILKATALWTLGLLLKFPMMPADKIRIVSETVIKNLSAPVERVRQTAINAAAQTAPITEVFDESLTRLGEAGDQYALAAIASTLMMNKTEMKGKAHFNEWVRLLCKLSPQTKGGIDSFDYVLYQLINDESHQQFAISCLADWVHANTEDTLNDNSVTKLFDSTMSELAKRRTLLSQVITDWILSESRQLASAAAAFLSYLWVHGIKDPEFSTLRLDSLEPSDLLFLARRMLGYVSSEEHLISLTMSLLKIKDASHRTFRIVHSLLVDELAQDYPASTVEAVEAAKSLTKESELITFYLSINEEINGRMNKLKALPRLEELRPQTSLQRQFVKARAKQMSAMAEEAEKKSIFSQIATKITIKAGIGSFSFRDGGYTEATYLRPYSTEVAVPRRDAIDTVGYEISRLMLRHAKRGES